MHQPDDDETGRRSSSARLPTERPTISDPVPPTEKVQIYVNEQARESLEDIERTLKRGLEARQVGVHLARCVRRT